MLSELYIENFIIIKKINIEFAEKFNVITGETGSGKSILVNSLQLLLGARFQKNFFGKYSNKSVVEGKFIINSKKKQMEFESAGYTLDDNELIITREAYLNGKTSNKLNGRNINLSLLKELMMGIMDIHSQNENQTLLRRENYLNIIDSFDFDNLNEDKKSLKQLIDSKSIISNKKDSLSLTTQELDREKDILKYHINELEKLDLDNINEEDIIKEYTLLSNMEEIISNLNKFNSLYNSIDYNEIDIISLIEQSKGILNLIEEKDENIKGFYEELNEISYDIQELSREIKRYTENLDIDEEKMEILNSQIEILTNLKRKYGSSITELVKYKDNCYERLEELNNIEENIKKLNNEIAILDEKILKITSNMTLKRKKISSKLEKNILFNIKELNMGNAKFNIKFTKLDEVNYTGIDKVDFYISTNIGQKMEPINKIASGGELSRIMLGFKVALADVDDVETLVFDEIDTGISGRTAQLVGEKLIDISSNRQIIVISHLPQIASLGEYHLLIDKEEIDVNTISSIYNIDKEKRIDEIARLIGGVDITKTTKKQAKEMLMQGEKLIFSKRSKNE